MTTENQAHGDLGWAIVELMGRTVIAGYVSEQVVAGAPMLRVDVPATAQDAAFTKFYNAGSSVYGITPTDEATALAAVQRLRVRPVTPFVLPTQPMLESRRGRIHDRDYDSSYEPASYDYSDDLDDDPDDDGVDF